MPFRRAAIYAGLVLMTNFLIINGAFDDVETATSWSVAVALYGTVYFIAGMLSGEWKALALAPLGWIVIALHPESSDEARGLALVILLPVAAIGLSIGVLCRKLLPTRRQHAKQ